MISRIFIERPVLASVISVVITLIGLVMIFRLPIDRYPPITPPTVRVTAQYIGASAEVVEQTVAAPIEQQLNGVENMIYFDSKATNDGRFTLTATFEVGTDLDLAAVQVQNRVALAEPQLPEEVRRNGISVRKQSTSLLMVVALESPGDTYDQLFLSNYTKINVRDALARIYGVGDVQLPGEREYGMRVWLDPDALFKLGLTAPDVTRAIQEQNVQAAAGRIGQSPVPKGQEFEYTVRTSGRLANTEQFGNIILRANADGSTVRVKDVARTELGAFDYSVFSRFNGKDAVNILIYQLPGSNAVDVANKVKAELNRLTGGFPNDVRYRLVYDSTDFIRASIEEVLHTLVEAIILVILVVFLFLQSWRATLIPLITVPVSLIGAFMFFPILGFSINVLTLFGLVLAIGIVVDDAIVVVEAVEQYIERGFSPKEAAFKAMEEVSGAVVAIALILVAVFVPVAFLDGITGQLYRQFALTIAISVVLSAINALTLSPALCALLLKPRHEVANSRNLLDRFFGLFNRFFERTLGAYSRTVRALLRRTVLVGVTMCVLFASIYGFYQITPGAFLPSEDEGYFIVDISLPNAASLERTEQVMRQVEAVVSAQVGVKDVFNLGGQSFVSGNNASSVGTLIGVLKPWHLREAKGEDALSIVQSLQQKLFGIPGAFILVFNPPPIQGLGNTGGFNLKLQDKGGSDVANLARVTDQFLNAARSEPAIAQAVTTFQPNEPQLQLEVDRERAKTMNVPISDVFLTLQTYLGGLYVNDFNLFGRTYRVVAQADPKFRRKPEDISRLYVRSNTGQMIPLSVLVRTTPTNGPLSIGRYNLFRATDVLGGSPPGFSSGQAIAALEKAAKTLPSGFGIEWTGMSYQEIKAGSALGVFAFSLLMVVLFLAAQYESWIIPFAVILGVPAGVLGAIGTQYFRGIPDDVYCRIGLIMLIGLAAKNAILIVEFARLRRRDGLSIDEASMEAARLRFRPILMTSFAFILGVVPLMISTGAGAASRRSLGSAVFGGMLLATIVGVFTIPVFFKWMQTLSEGFNRRKIVDTAPAITGCLLLLLLTSCRVGPQYQRPALPTPQQHRADLVKEESAASIGDLKWAELFQDARLKELIAEALSGNYNLRLAAERIIAARATLRSTRAAQLPELRAGAAVTEVEQTTRGSFPLPPTARRELATGRGSLDIGVPLDFWGRLARATEVSRAELLSQEWAQAAVRQNLVSEVASTYFQLIEVDREHSIAEQTLALRRQSLRLVEARNTRGVTSGLEVSQAEVLVASAATRLPQLERQREQLENALALLLGKNPQSIPGRQSLESQRIPPEIPAGLPSQLLQRRPDLQQAEQQLRAATERIGIAQANRFPNFSLTGSFGFESLALGDFLSDPARFRQWGPSVTIPILNAGRLKANLAAAQAQARQAAISYELTFQSALRETSDSLIAYRRLREQRQEQQRLIRSLEEANRLSKLRYQGGVDSYLQVLDSDRTLFENQFTLAQLLRDELLAVVSLYRALGGGWQTP
jgi:hydrophobe/amphiphile efflux-1 (HAE1) family protein/NodT family efflux transporter outer membrane factor (OMF) lipoprotein